MKTCERCHGYGVKPYHVGPAIKPCPCLTDRLNLLERIVKLANEGAWRTVFEHQPRGAAESPVLKVALFLKDPDEFRDLIHSALEDT